MVNRKNKDFKVSKMSLPNGFVTWTACDLVQVILSPWDSIFSNYKMGKVQLTTQGIMPGTQQVLN